MASGANSNTGNSNTGNSNGGTSNTGSTPPPGQTLNTDKLTQGLKDLQKNGKADIKLSTETRDKYLKIISTFRSTLQAERNKMSNQQSLGNPGALNSAAITKENLQLDITGLLGAQRSVDSYLHYLDEFETTVKKAADRMIQSG